MAVIRNYTSTISSARSIQAIEQKLIDSGASHVMKQIDDQKRVIGIVFQITHPDQRIFPIQLPARIDNVFMVLKKARSWRSRTTDEALYEQAERTAWKLLHEWVEVQFALIQINQVEFMEVFMPYIFDGKSKQTMYQLYRDSGFKQITGS